MENFIFCAVTVILKIQQILGSCKLNKWPHLFLATSTQKSSEIIVSFCFIPSILFWEMQSILESRDQTCHKHFWSFFDLCGFLSTCKKTGYFTDSFWRYGSLKNSAIWLAENILAHISGTKGFPGICAGTQQIINIFIIEQIQ